MPRERYPEQGQIPVPTEAKQKFNRASFLVSGGMPIPHSQGVQQITTHYSTLLYASLPPERLGTRTITSWPE
jgi:hypothetical protein